MFPFNDPPAYSLLRLSALHLQYLTRHSKTATKTMKLVYSLVSLVATVALASLAVPVQGPLSDHSFETSVGTESAVGQPQLQPQPMSLHNVGIASDESYNSVLVRREDSPLASILGSHGKGQPPGVPGDRCSGNYIEEPYKNHPIPAPTYGRAGPGKGPGPCYAPNPGHRHGGRGRGRGSG